MSATERPLFDLVEWTEDEHGECSAKIGELRLFATPPVYGFYAEWQVRRLGKIVAAGVTGSVRDAQQQAIQAAHDRYTSGVVIRSRRRRGGGGHV